MPPSKLARILRHRIGTVAHDVGAATRGDVRALMERLAAQSTALEATDDRLRLTLAELDRTRARLATLEAAATHDHLQAILALQTVVRHQPLRRRPLVSIVLPTRSRPELLPRAIDSVRAQRYEHWELLVVDDSGTGESRQQVRAFDEPRIRYLEGDAAGVCAARNVALRAARGELVAYLDDDNMMDRDWLQAVVWAAETHPDVEVVYGAFVIDDLERVTGESSGELPRIVLHRFREGVLALGNIADMGAIAHRAGLEGAWFDEELTTMGDWDLLVRLTRERPPLMVPAIACLYTTDAPRRLTLSPSAAEDARRVRERAAG